MSALLRPAEEQFSADAPGGNILVWDVKVEIRDEFFGELDPESTSPTRAFLYQQVRAALEDDDGRL